MRAPTYRQNAVFAGVFFIVATVALIPAGMLYGPPLSDGTMIAAAASPVRVGLGTLVEMLCVIAIPLIAVALYPVLTRVSAALAVGYVAFRSIEAALFASNEVARLLVVQLGQAAAAHPEIDTGALALLMQARIGNDAWSGAAGPVYNLIAVTGMMLLYAGLWRGRLVPRWISAWGLASAGLLGGVAAASFFMSVPSRIALPLIAPLALQEMALAVWMIAKGFDRAALARLA